MKIKLLFIIVACLFIMSCQKTTLDSKISTKNYYQDIKELYDQFLITSEEHGIIDFNMQQLIFLERQGEKIPDSFLDKTYRDILIFDKMYNE